MKRTFVETTDFAEKIESLKEDGLLKTIQGEILKNPEAGDIVPGLGGIRKIRVGASGKGKSGGIRFFYLDIPTKGRCYLLFILQKSEAANISSAEKKELREIAQILKK